MSEDQFTKLFRTMQDEFGKIRAELETTRTELKADINRVYDLVDDDLKHRQTDEQERSAMHARLDRHESWITQLADGTSIKLAAESDR